VDTWFLALAVFLLTAVLILWRPGRIHEAIPALAGAFALFLLGFVERPDVLRVMAVVWNAAMTIIATFVMASVLEGAGFFRWVTDRLIERAEGSGYRLFHLVLAFSACLTLFLNNDGSILLGTPVVLGLVRRLRLTGRAALGYLIGACLIASASSPPIGVSNMANLEAMSLVHISLTEHLHAVAIPALMGLAFCWWLVYLLFRRHLPPTLALTAAAFPESSPFPGPGLPHPHALRPRHHRPGPPPPPPPLPPPPVELRVRPAPPAEPGERNDPVLQWFAVGIVVLVRVGYFAASAAGFPTYVVAVTGACILLAANALRRNAVSPREAIRRAPWAVLGFAFGMDLVVFGIKNAGIISAVAVKVGPAVESSRLAATMLPAGIATLVSAFLNNHPGLISGSLMLLEMPGLVRPALYTAYAGVVLGSDLGALVTPVGTLAVLIWFHMLRQHGYEYSWWDYTRITLLVIPAAFLCALGGLYVSSMLFGF